MEIGGKDLKINVILAFEVSLHLNFSYPWSLVLNRYSLSACALRLPFTEHLALQLLAIKCAFLIVSAWKIGDAVPLIFARPHSDNQQKGSTLFRSYLKTYKTEHHNARVYWGGAVDEANCDSVLSRIILDRIVTGKSNQRSIGHTQRVKDLHCSVQPHKGILQTIKLQNTRWDIKKFNRRTA